MEIDFYHITPNHDKYHAGSTYIILECKVQSGGVPSALRNNLTQLSSDAIIEPSVRFSHGDSLLVVSFITNDSPITALSKVFLAIDKEFVLDEYVSLG